MKRGSSSWRGLLVQAAILVASIALFAWMADNARQAIARRGVATGFDFLSEAGSFAIGQAFFDFEPGRSYVAAFAAGLGNTAILALAGIVTATLLGTLIGLGRLSSNRLLSSFGAAYVELFRNSPPLLLILFLYTVFPLLPGSRQAWSVFDGVFISNRGIVVPAPDHPGVIGELALWLFAGAAASALLYRIIDLRRRRGRRAPPLIAIVYGILLFGPVLVAGMRTSWSAPRLQGFNFTGGVTLSPEFMALYIGLSLYASAFIAELVRAGILSIDRGQIEAADAIGLGAWDRFFKIEAPQALRVIVPPLASQYISVVKNSSLGVAIGYPELFSLTNTILTYSGHTIEVISIMAAIYLLLSLAIGGIASLVNHAVQIGER